MERKILSEELGRMAYLFGYKRGVVISEQDLVGQSNDPKKSGVDVSTSSPNWNGNSSGSISISGKETPQEPFMKIGGEEIPLRLFRLIIA
jgi:hypothetical protein